MDDYKEFVLNFIKQYREQIAKLTPEELLELQERHQIRIEDYATRLEKKIKDNK